jgi:hypothetical protein
VIILIVAKLFQEEDNALNVQKDLY